MSKKMENAKEEENVFKQELSLNELECVRGGDGGEGDNCVDVDNRDIYMGRFPNCAATVESDSWCDSSDACFDVAIVYYVLEDCHKAWH